MKALHSDFLYKTGLHVTIVGAVANIFLVICKFLAGYFGKSAALIADSIHSLSDLITDLVVLVSIKISNKPKDDEHPYGHGRAETIGATLIGVLLIGVGIGFAVKAAEIIHNGTIMVPTSIAIAGAVVSICVKEAAYRYTIHAGRAVESPVIVANAHHHRSDALSSVVVLIGIAGALSGFKVCDPAAAVAVAFFIIKVGFDIFWNGIQELMDASVSHDMRRKIETSILDTDEVVSFHDLKTRKISRDTLVEVHIQVDPYISVSEGHNIAENVRGRILSRMKNMGEVMVHIDTEDDGDGIYYNFTRSQMEERVRNSIQTIHPLGKHFDLQVHYLSGKALLDLNVELPSEMSIKEGREIAREVRANLVKMEEVLDVKVRLNLIE